MRILYANVIEQNAGWGAEVFMNRALRRLGHETYTIDYRKYRHRLARPLAAVPDFDCFFLQRGERFPLAVVAAVRRPRIFWASELVARRRDQDRLLRSGLFDHVFLRTADCIATAVTRGWCEPDRCSVLLSSFDPTLHRPLGTPKDIDVLFVGAMTPRRERWVTELSRRHTVTTATAFGEDLVGLINRARIVLNIHAEDFPDTETRVYEVLGCGTLLVTEPLSAECPFSEGELVVCATPDDMGNAIDRFLSDETGRERLARKGHRAALEAHTVDHRAAQVAAAMASQARPVGQRAVDTRRAGYVLYRAIEPLRYAASRARSLFS
jgi:hypothetical protein